MVIAHTILLPGSAIDTMGSCKVLDLDPDASEKVGSVSSIIKIPTNNFNYK